MEPTYLEKSSTVTIPFLSITTSSTLKSSFRWISIGRFWLYTVLSSFGVSCTLNSVFIQFTFYVWQVFQGTRIEYVSTACLSVSVSSVSVQSICSGNFIRDFVSSFGFSFFCCSSCSSLRIGVWSSMLPGFSGVGNQKVLFCWSGLFILSNSVKLVVIFGSPSGIILRITVSSGFMNLDCSGVTTENSAICVFLLFE